MNLVPSIGNITKNNTKNNVTGLSNNAIPNGPISIKNKQPPAPIIAAKPLATLDTNETVILIKPIIASNKTDINPVNLYKILPIIFFINNKAPLYSLVDIPYHSYIKRILHLSFICKYFLQLTGNN